MSGFTINEHLNVLVLPTWMKEGWGKSTGEEAGKVRSCKEASKAVLSRLASYENAAIRRRKKYHHLWPCVLWASDIQHFDLRNAKVKTTACFVESASYNSWLLWIPYLSSCLQPRNCPKSSYTADNCRRVLSRNSSIAGEDEEIKAYYL